MTDTTPQPFNLAGVLDQIRERTAIRYPVCYDPGLREQYATAQRELDNAQAALARAEKAEDGESGYLTSAPGESERARVEAAQDVLDAAKEAAKAAQLVVVFRGWLGTEWDEVAKSHADKAVTDYHAALCEMAFVRVETPDGEPVPDADWATVRDHLMTAGDRRDAGLQIDLANSKPTSIPF